MDGEMRALTRYEVEKLMCKVSRERSRILKKFVEKALALEVGGEFFQCHVTALSDVDELRSLINETGTDMKFHIWKVINGFWVKREA